MNNNQISSATMTTQEVYRNLKFPRFKNRSTIYANFVEDIGGIIKVLENPDPYWPIGSQTDFQTLLDLRAISDAMIHGSNTALEFNHLERISTPQFMERRRKFGKEAPLKYFVLSNHPNENLVRQFEHSGDNKPVLVTNEQARVSANLSQTCEILRIGQDAINLHQFAAYLFEHGFKNVLMEGGPTLFRSFLKARLIDQLFLTKSNKILGYEPGKTLTLVEGGLFAPDEVPQPELISVKQVESELFLRYRFPH